MPGQSRIGVLFSSLYSFSCLRLQFRDEHNQIGQKGFPKVIYCNDPENPQQLQLRYRSNYVSTTKCNVFNFIPKSLFEQFRRVANIYFLVVAFVSFSPLAPYTATSILVPLLVVIRATMAKEAIEDWRHRKQVLICMIFLRFSSYSWLSVFCLFPCFTLQAMFDTFLVLFECIFRLIVLDFQTTCNFTRAWASIQRQELGFLINHLSPVAVVTINFFNLVCYVHFFSYCSMLRSLYIFQQFSIPFTILLCFWFILCQSKWLSRI